jgi:hypothetical protein
VSLLVVVAIVVAIMAGVVFSLAHARPLTHANVSATATSQAIAGNTLLADPLTSNANGWAEDANHCYFAQDGYHANDGYLCYAPIGVQTDGTESVTVKQISGPPDYAYGLVARRVSKGNYYFFGVDSNSEWEFAKVVNGKFSRLQDYTVNSAINGGLNTGNSLSITMSGSTFDCYSNGIKLGTIHDSTFPEGKWGVASNTGVNVVFTDYLARR